MKSMKSTTPGDLLPENQNAVGVLLFDQVRGILRKKTPVNMTTPGNGDSYWENTICKGLC